ITGTTSGVMKKRTISADNMYSTELFVPDSSRQTLNEFNIALGKLLGKGVSTSKKQSEKIAYSEAINKLNEHKLSIEKIDVIKSIKKISDILPREDLRRFNRKINQSGF